MMRMQMGKSPADESVDGLGCTRQMRAAVISLARNHDYEEAAREAKTEPETVREWARNPDFALAIGLFVVGLADCK